jgi:Haem-binding domain
MSDMTRKLVPMFAAAAILATGCSLIHPFGKVNSHAMKVPILSGAEIDPETRGLIERACQNCHSLNTELPFYGRIAPMSWLMARDVYQARRHMNLSQWQDYSAGDRIILLSEVGSAVKNHEMPVQRYVLLHSEARLSDQEREQIYQWTRAERKRLKFAPSPSGDGRQDDHHLRPRRESTPRMLAQTNVRIAVH